MTNTLSKYATAGEARVARKLVRAALAAGYAISVNDGEAWTVKRSTREREILDALATTGEDWLRLYLPATGESAGTFQLIYGNDPDGSELIADHTDNNTCAALYEAAHSAAPVTVAAPAWHGEA